MKPESKLAIALLSLLTAGLLACSSAVAPCEKTGAEECNGRDDDCNGKVDDGLSRDCESACGTGTEVCEEGEWVNCDAPQPRDETCNNQDDDCNQIVDDGLTACACTGGNPPGNETCNRIDDDCDEQIDEDLQFCACTGGNPPGTETCNRIDDDCNQAIDDGLTACACTGGNPPGTETCNQIDDDCDGCIDEGPASPCTPLVRTCSSSCGQGTETCVDGTWRNCDAPTPSTETCNNSDDDCNGTVDDGLAACQCSGGNPPGLEICDGIDNDCDEQIDEDNGAGGQCRGFGEPCELPRDCVSQVCAGDFFARYCSQECDPPDCPAGYRCYVGPSINYCLRNYPPCDSNADCAADGQVCTVHDADDLLSKVTECRPPLNPGGDPGDDCSSSQCANDLCRNEVCSEVCSDASPCTEQYLGRDTTCVLRGQWMFPGECARAEQCPPSYSCDNTNCRGPGCTDDSQCESGYQCDDTDLVCVPQPLVSYVGMCQIGCVADRDCPAGWVCGPAVAADRSRIQGYCRPPYTGEITPTGVGPCGSADDPPCDHGICYRAGGGNTYCTQLCGNAADCPVGLGMSCTPGTLYMGELGDFPNTYTCTF